MKRLRARSSLGKYRIERRIGEGGFATVYAATDTVEGVRVAVKVPHAEYVSPEALRLFRSEARLHSGLDHPNILPIKNAELIDGHFVIVYPVGLGSLADRLRKRMSLDTFLKLAEQMLEAVAHAHAHKIIHRDLKPDNFILFADNRIRLCDFSIAKLALRTVRGSGSGTVGYAAPEQAMGRPSLYSDVFSLGLIFWEMLAGELPEWPFEWPLAGHAKLRGKVHPDFVTFLRRALEIDPRRRFPDARAMLNAFLKLKPRMRRLVGKQRRRREASNGTTNSDNWRQVRFREFRRAHRTELGLDYTCAHCDGPVSDRMRACPWCGKAQRAEADDTTFPAHCPRCHRGRKLDWSYCAWCFGPGFEEVSERSFPDHRYQGRCENSPCRGPLIPFMRYCPWCRGRVRKPWKILGTRDRCHKCGWGVVRGYWDHCPWCTQRLT